jgi:hypothetical protein
MLKRRETATAKTKKVALKRQRRGKRLAQPEGLGKEVKNRSARGAKLA